MAASKQTYTHMCACSPASVGLTQTHPNFSSIHMAQQGLYTPTLLSTHMLLPTTKLSSLLVCRSDHKGHWIAPPGHQEYISVII